MVRKGLVMLAITIGLLLGAAGGATAAVARNDAVRAKLVATANGGYKVVLAFRDLLRNDRLTNPVKGRKVIRTPRSDGIRSVLLKGGGKRGQRRVVVRFTKRFLDDVLDSGRARTSFAYLIADSCRKGKCGGRLGRALVRLTVISPN